MRYTANNPIRMSGREINIGDKISDAEIVELLGEDRAERVTMNLVKNGNLDPIPGSDAEGLVPEKPAAPSKGGKSKKAKLEIHADDKNPPTPVIPPEKDASRVTETDSASTGTETGMRQAHLFDLDPANLADIELEQLNVMISERDPEAQAFETREEAVAYLSKDFQG